MKKTENKGFMMIIGLFVCWIVGAAVLFNKKRHVDDFIGFDTDETETVDVEVEEETEKSN